jgi:hypothetical protein
MTRRLLGWLLHRANSSPPLTGRTEFYALKDRLLARYGTPDGEDVQHIADGCWGCDGTGRYDGSGYRCRKCWDTGVYRERWTRLVRWTLGGYRFHTIAPRQDVWGPGTPASIEGRVARRDYGRLAAECQLWLALALDRRLFRRLVSGSCYCSPGLWPMLRLQKVAFDLRMFAGRLKRRTCSQCGRPFRRWTAAGWVACRACRVKPTDRVSEDTPF